MSTFVIPTHTQPVNKQTNSWKKWLREEISDNKKSNPKIFCKKHQKLSFMQQKDYLCIARLTTKISFKKKKLIKCINNVLTMYYLASTLQLLAEFLFLKDEADNLQSLGKDRMKHHLHKVSLQEIQHWGHNGAILCHKPK